MLQQQFSSMQTATTPITTHATHKNNLTGISTTTSNANTSVSRIVGVPNPRLSTSAPTSPLVHAGPPPAIVPSFGPPAPMLPHTQPTNVSSPRTNPAFVSSIGHNHPTGGGTASVINKSNTLPASTFPPASNAAPSDNRPVSRVNTVTQPSMDDGSPETETPDTALTEDQKAQRECLTVKPSLEGWFTLKVFVQH